MNLKNLSTISLKDPGSLDSYRMDYMSVNSELKTLRNKMIVTNLVNSSQIKSSFRHFLFIHSIKRCLLQKFLTFILKRKIFQKD